jgi:hypothetical protein
MKELSQVRRLRPLNLPGPIIVEADSEGRPEVLTISRRKLHVVGRHETWRIDDEWWRPAPVSRTYWRVSLEDGRTMDIYHDLASSGWFRQSYG